MKKTYSNKRCIFRVVVSTILLLVLNTKVNAQEVVKQFTQRTSTFADNKYKKPNTDGKIYNLRGDFKMAGNTNLTLTNYTNNGSNNTDMSFVDIDFDTSTINSSSAFLDINDDTCNEIVYAGLYWSGRASTGNRTFSETANVYSLSTTATNEPFYHNNPSNDYYSMQIIRQTTSCGILCETYNPLYRFNFEGTILEFNFTNNTTSAAAVTYRYGTSGDFLPTTGTLTTSGLGSNVSRFTFTTPFIVNVNGREYKINYINRDSRTTRSQNEYRDTSYGYAQVNLKTVTSSSLTKTLDKRVVRFKKDNGAYQTITANSSDIYFPTSNNTHSGIYTAYADVTQYVKTNKGGNYYVADLATTDGDDPGSTGYFGGWGLVVIYANPNMKWRDITIFDGHAYMEGNNFEEFSLSGFQAAQNGVVKVDMGLMAAEGDVSVPGDNFRIQTGTSTNWTTLSHSLNNSNNFFNSSIQVDGARYPNLQNNTGIDIVKIEVPNTGNSVIGNNQTSTKFRYGSDGDNGGGNNRDTYVIFNVVFAVDAYVPEGEAENSPISIVTYDINGDSTTISDAISVENRMGNLQPNDEVTMRMELFNYGNERIVNGKIDINIPNAMKLVSAYSINADTPVSTAHVTGQSTGYILTFPQPQYLNPLTNNTEVVNGPYNIHGGIISWDLGTIPMQLLPNTTTSKKPLATLIYTLKVTDDCSVLRTSDDMCALEPKIDGNITGTGQNSGTPLKPEFIIGRLADCNNSPIYGTTDFTIDPDPLFFAACPSQIQNNGLYFEYFCEMPYSNSVIPRSEIDKFYPLGTRFYNVNPTSPGFNVNNTINGDFTVVLENINPSNTLEGREEWFYALLPGTTNMGCFYNIHIKVLAIGTLPEVENGLEFCKGQDFEIPVVLTVDEIANPNVVLKFYTSDATNAVPVTIDKPNLAIGSHTYWVSKQILNSNGTVKCASLKVPVTFEIKGCSMKVNPQIYNKFKRP